MPDLFGSKKSNTQKKKKKTVGWEALKPELSVGETVDSLDFFRPKSLGKALTEQVKPQGQNWAAEWLGFGKSESSDQGSVDMQPGVAYSPKQQAELEAQREQAEKAQEAPREAAMEYAREIIHAGETGNRKEQQESGQKIQMLIQELSRLATSVAQVEKTMILQAIDPSAGQKTGKYYESFFEWMLLVVQDARRKVEDSGAWLTAMSSKKGKGGGIHKLMKTNMQIGMSGERTNANNTG